MNELDVYPKIGPTRAEKTNEALEITTNDLANAQQSVREAQENLDNAILRCEQDDVIEAYRRVIEIAVEVEESRERDYKLVSDIWLSQWQ